MKTQRALAFSIVLILWAVCTACAHSPPSAPAKMDPASGGGAWQNSSIDLSYEFGHIHRRIVAQVRENQVTGQSFYEHQVLRENRIDSARYQQFLQRSLDFIQTQQRTPATDLEQCKNPFVLTVRIGTETRIHKGCRSSEDASYGVLVKEGEFLLYSKK